MKIDIPGLGSYNLKHVFIDYNGTIAYEGKLLDNMLPALTKLTQTYQVHIITGDTYGNVSDIFKNTDINLILASTARDKADLVSAFDKETCISIGNGAIDALMFNKTAISIAILGKEGCSIKALKNADILVQDIYDAFKIITNKNQLIATLKE